MRELTISVAPSRFSKEWEPRQVSWADLTRQLSACKRTRETGDEYRAMTKDDRAKVKDIGGFVGGYVKGARKASAVMSRSLVTLDIDYADDETIPAVREMLDGNAWCLYSTHSHTPGKPRFRLVVPLDRDVMPLEYEPIARRIAYLIGIDRFDDSTYEPHRLMYWPSSPKDVEPVFELSEGAPLRADGVLGTYRDWRNVLDYPLSSRQTEHAAAPGSKQEDPTLKPGLIGAFCRVYGISDAIETFLSDVYEPTATEGRYTYKEGSTAGGLVVYEDKWAYSHHGTDPVGGREVNAFDLVRIHRFGGLDDQTGEEAPVTRLPSFKAMEEFAGGIAEVKADAVAHGLRQSAEEAFGDEMSDESGQLKDGRMDVIKAVIRRGGRADKHNNLVCDPFTVRLIMEEDPALRGTVRYDCFADRNELTRDLPWAKVTEDHRIWTDHDDNALIVYMSEKYGVSGKWVIIDAHDTIIAGTSYHPIREYLNGLTWDGVERLDTMIIDYLGAQDNPLTRAMTRKHMVAAVARVMHPGEKYDYALTLSGPEGIGKTTLVSKLGMKWFDNSFSSGDVGDKSSMEQVQGRWLIELGELVSIRKNTNEAFKHFLTKEKDKFRPAYGHKSIEVPRQCVFWATTNERCYLKGDTGNRRFWTIYVGEDTVTKNVFAMSQEDIDQLWAEAVVRYKEGEVLCLPPELREAAKQREEEANEIASDDRAGVIEAFIRRPLPADWYNKTLRERADWFRIGHGEEFQGAIRREYICAREVAAECFQKDMTRYEIREINQLLFRLKGLELVGTIRTRDKAYGGQRRYRINPEFWVADEPRNNERG